MRALVWHGINDLRVETVNDPEILRPNDAIVKVTMTASCGSDLHLVGGYMPVMRAGDVLGHEFMGEIVEVGSGVKNRRVGDRVVVNSFLSCGECWYCKQGLTSMCDNTNAAPGLNDLMWGASLAGCFGFGNSMGGYAGSHADYVRVPFADTGTFLVPDSLSDEQAVFVSDAVPTGWMGAKVAGVKPGDTVAVFGAGGVGQMAARSAMLLGAEQVIVIDRLPERLEQVHQHIGAETLNYETDELFADLRERTGGRGPDVCIEAVGMEAHSAGPGYLYDQVKAQLRLQTDRPTAVRHAIQAVRKGGTVFVLGVYGGVVDKFPLGAMMNKGLTIHTGQQNGHQYTDMLLKKVADGEISTGHLATHPMSLEDAAYGYDIFKHKKDGCVRSVFTPGAPKAEPRLSA